MNINLINVSQYPANAISAEERDFWGQLELEEIDLPLSRNEAFRVIEGRVFEAVWPDDNFPW